MPTSIVPWTIMINFVLFTFGFIFFLEDIDRIRFYFCLTLLSIFAVLFLIVASFKMMFCSNTEKVEQVIEETEQVTHIERIKNIVSMSLIFLVMSFLPMYVPTAYISLSFSNYHQKDKKLKNELFEKYQPCQTQNCHQSFILDKDKFSKRNYQVDITDKCVTIKPVHNYDFLYYEAQKCGDEITEKEYHSAAKFLKNVATLNFGSVFDTQK